ncbi:hypothetical protein [Zavarzinella formosa]|uniref:hypothetical protein n=1 Tax=Zavarzinella formosa TaxID=360055 RepID=UPI00036F7C00|nr:hypothetical protein [Zavarzinella formosa]
MIDLFLPPFAISAEALATTPLKSTNSLRWPKPLSGVTAGHDASSSLLAGVLKRRAGIATAGVIGMLALAGNLSATS